MADEQPRYPFDRVVRIVLSAAVFIGVFVLVRYLSDVLLPFVAAVVLAYLLNPLVTVFEQKTKRRGLSVALTIGGLFVVGLAIVAVLIPLMIGQVGRQRLRGGHDLRRGWYRDRCPLHVGQRLGHADRLWPGRRGALTRCSTVLDSVHPVEGPIGHETSDAA